MVSKKIYKCIAKSPFLKVPTACGLVILCLMFPLSAVALTAPYVQDDAASTLKNTPVVVSVLLNDNGDWVGSAITQASNGVVTGVKGTLQYTPNTDFEGIDTFTYTLTDSSGPSFTATVNITVVASTTLGVQDDSATSQRNTAVPIDVLANDTGNWVDGMITQPLSGSVKGIAYGVVEYTPNANFVGFDKFTYTLIDSSGPSFSATVNITVLAGAVPDLQADTAITRSNSSVTIAVLENDAGYWVDGGVTQPGSGSITATGPNDEHIKYTPNVGFLGVDTFTYSATDKSGPTLTTTVTVAVNDSPIAKDDFTAVNLNTSVTVSVQDNDDIVTTVGFASKSFTQPDFGTVTEIGDNFVYAPDPGFTGFDRFSYTLTGHDNLASKANVSIGVSPVVFNDVTATSGIDYVQCVAPCLGPPTPMTGGAAAGDFDGDGNVDLYVTRGDAADILYRNNGDGTFNDVTASSGINRVLGSNGAAWGDIDNDGDIDLYVTSTNDTRFYLYINNGTGVFTEEAVARGASTEGIDVHDGFSASLGDYNKDGYLDIHTTEWRHDAKNVTGALSNSRLLRNRGSINPGSFDDVTQTAGVALDSIDGGIANGTYAFTSKFTDLDNDGLLDLAVSADGKESRLFWNNGDGTFTDGTVSAGVAGDENGMGTAISDVNGDGLLDWFVSSIYDPDALCAPNALGIGTTGNRLYINNGDRTFTDATTAVGVRDGGWGWAATFIDYDNDGDQDLIQTNGVQFPGNPNTDCWEKDQMRLFDNDGSGIFTEKASTVGLFETGAGKGLLKFDYDNDGDLDVFIVNTWGQPVLYRNDGGNNNDWLRVEFDTTDQFVGARILVEQVQGGPTQIREVNNNSNFLAQDEVVSHFGLGQGSLPVSSVTIRMPSGVIRNFTDVPRNSVLTVTDP